MPACASATPRSCSAPSASSASASAPESPDWGSAINEGRKLLRIYIHPALPPALALMSFVLGLNLLADALREQIDEGLTTP